MYYVIELHTEVHTEVHAEVHTTVRYCTIDNATFHTEMHAIYMIIRLIKTLCVCVVITSLYTRGNAML